LIRTVFTVYDRWGNQVFAGSEWNGKRNGSFVNSGVYAYVLWIKMDDGIERQFTGNVTLIK
jgi:CHU_C Type IX secretion signal domain